MSATITVPVTVTDEAAAYVAKLGLQQPFEEMIAHAQKTIPKLHQIEVTLEPPYFAGETDRVVIWAHKEYCGPDYDTAEDDYGSWLVQAYPPEVFTNIILLTPFLGPHE